MRSKKCSFFQDQKTRKWQKQEPNQRLNLATIIQFILGHLCQDLQQNFLALLTNNPE